MDILKCPFLELVLIYLSLDKYVGNMVGGGVERSRGPKRRRNGW